MSDEVPVVAMSREGAQWVQHRKSDLICREVDGKLVGLDLRSSRYFSLNALGTVLWHMLDDGADPAALAAALRATSAIDAATAERDVQAFIDMLGAQGLLE